MADQFPRPWHGACDREDDQRVRALRLQRMEVQTLLDYRRAKEDSGEAIELWRKLCALREQRIAVMEPDAAAKLPALPAAPPSVRAVASRPAAGGWRRLLGFMGRNQGGAGAVF